MEIGKKEFDVQQKTYVMGILNLTPDSFSDGGRWNAQDAALYRAEQMIDEGASVIDVGGESTRPGYTQISDEEEIGRVAPVIEKIRERFDVPISIDTYKSRVAQAAVDAGADLVNDVWGLKYDEKMAGLIARTGVACCLMHNRKKAEYGHFLTEVKQDLAETLQLARDAGIKEDKIILDPGVGFGKTYGHNLEVICSLAQFGELGCPLLLGASRKSVIGNALGLPVQERLEGTLVTTVFAVLGRCSFVRVHDVKENVRAVRMAEEILMHRDLG